MPVITTEKRNRFISTAHRFDKLIESFYDQVSELCEDTCYTKKDATDFMKFIEEHQRDLVASVSILGAIEFFIDMKDDYVDEEGGWQ